MEGTKVTKVFRGTVYEGKDEFLVRPDNPKGSSSLQEFLNQYMKDYDGQSVTIKVSLDIDPQ